MSCMFDNSRINKYCIKKTSKLWAFKGGVAVNMSGLFIIVVNCSAVISYKSYHHWPVTGVAPEQELFETGLRFKKFGNYWYQF